MQKSTRHLDNRRKKADPPTDMPGAVVVAELHAVSALMIEFISIMLLEMPEDRQARVLADMISAADRAKRRTGSQAMHYNVPLAAESMLTEILTNLQSRAAGET